MITISTKAHHTLKIFALAVITLAIAGAIGLFFPELAGVPTINELPTDQPQQYVPVIFDNLNNHDRLKPGQMITGEVSGRWFFEGSFPVQLKDLNGTSFATVIATTAEDWMTTEHVSFSIAMPNHFSYTGIGSLYLKKDDPSDGEAPFDPAKDEQTIPVIFENE